MGHKLRWVSVLAVVLMGLSLVAALYPLLRFVVFNPFAAYDLTP